ncbi:MAG: hypothetical protein ACR2FG_13655 [Marmoricola sp.]
MKGQQDLWLWVVVTWMRNASLLIGCAKLTVMTRAVTVRLDEADHAALQEQAEQLRVRPGTLARILVHAGLSGNATDAGTDNARLALDRLVKRSQRQAPADAVELVADARVALVPHQ